MILGSMASPRVTDGHGQRLVRRMSQAEVQLTNRGLEVTLLLGRQRCTGVSKWLTRNSAGDGLRWMGLSRGGPRQQPGETLHQFQSISLRMRRALASGLRMLVSATALEKQCGIMVRMVRDYPPWFAQQLLWIL